MHDIYKLKEMLMNELSDYGARGQLRNAQDVAAVDQLARTCKNICKILESSDGEYSGDGYSRYEGTSGRRYARRDSMGRYSRSDGTMDKLKELMNDTQDDGLKREFKRLIEHMESR